MMKYYKIILPFAVFLLFAGCTAEDYGKCPRKNNVFFTFSLKDEFDNEVFSQHIEQADLAVFTDAGDFVRHFCVDKTGLDTLCGVDMALEPGNYHVVCWGNADQRSTLCNLNQASFGSAYLSHSGADRVDRLFFAPDAPASGTKGMEPYVLNVPRKGSVSDVLSFTQAYKTINVFVRNFTDHGTGTVVNPVIEIADHYERYDFTMVPVQGTPVSFAKPSVDTQTPSGVMGGASFTTSVFDHDTEIEVHLRQPSNGAIGYTVNLSRFLSEENIDPDNETEVTIVVTFIGGSVNITLPGWGHTPIIPEL